MKKLPPPMAKPVVFCRPMFCQKCYDNHLPTKGSHFFTVGTTHEHLDFHKAAKFGVRGYPPHIITFDNVLPDGRIKIVASCGIMGCGWSLVDNAKDEEVPNAHCNHATTIIMEALDYAALKKFKDPSYWLN